MRPKRLLMSKSAAQLLDGPVPVKLLTGWCRAPYLFPPVQTSTDTHLTTDSGIELLRVGCLVSNGHLEIKHHHCQTKRDSRRTKTSGDIIDQVEQ